MRSAISVAALAVLLAGCETIPQPDPARGIPVTASAQTVPVESTDDAADDPAIWHHPTDPAQSLIVGTDKQAGLYVYGLDGARRGFYPAGRVNNVDLLTVRRRNGDAVLVAASDRNDELTAHVSLFWLDPGSGALAPAGRIEAGPGEGYGFCMALAPDGLVHTFLNTKEGTIYHQRLDWIDGIQVRDTRTMTVPTQPEGCVVDGRNGTLYVGEEAAGVWRFDLETGEGELVIRTDGDRLVADVEGLALAPAGEDGGYLIASSQGDHAFAVYRLPDFGYVGRFYIADSETIDGVTETDGIELSLANFGPAFPNGLFVVQDGHTPSRRQNFKLVDWGRVIGALGLE
ncbi:phytase [Parasphingopyxis sp.]|uniref:phytase n=1 Tax=Parasphingopyxis sp. TaxID=1920299 RepID=UPI002610411D|nr:phytase [Parasphingopyxis sp.]